MKRPLFYTVTVTQEVAARVHVAADSEDAAREKVEALMSRRDVREKLAEGAEVLDDSWEIVFIDPVEEKKEEKD